MENIPRKIEGTNAYLTPDGYVYDADGQPLRRKMRDGVLVVDLDGHRRQVPRLLWTTFIGSARGKKIDTLDPRHPTIENIVMLAPRVKLNRSPLPKEADALERWKREAAARAWRYIDTLK